MSGHVAPKSLYYLVFGALLVGTLPPRLQQRLVEDG